MQEPSKTNQELLEEIDILKQRIQEQDKSETKDKQAEENSQNMLNFLQILINTIPSPIFRKDIHGRYQGCNKEFENYTGLRREEIIGKSVYDIYPKDVADKYHEMDLALFREPGRQIYEYPIMYADGERHDVVVNKATYLNDDGSPAGLVGVMVDITERKRTEDDLWDSKQRILNLTDNLLNVVVYQLTAEPEGGRRFTYISRAVERANEVTEEEVMADANVIYRQVLPAYLSVVREREDEALKNLTVMRVEVQSRLPSGRLRWFEYVSTPRYAADGFLVWDGVQVDITERKQAEEELARYREGLEKMVAERTQELENRTKTLEEVNIAMKVLLQHREEDKKDLEDRVVMNVKNLIIPFAEKMKSTHLDERQLAYLKIIETHLNDITSSMIKKMHQFNFTPTEVEVASLIKEGKATKEIAKIIGTATSSINTHRNNIRKKLAINKENVNLRSHLQSFGKY